MIEILFVFIIAKLKRYKLLPMFKEWSVYPVLICLATYIYLESMIWQGNYSLVKYSTYFEMMYLTSIIVLAFRYKQFKSLVYGLPLLWLGSILNNIAIKANFNKMPVFISNSWATGYAKPDIFINSIKLGDYHTLGNMYSNLIPLCDTWDFGFSIFSIGDILIKFCIFLILYSCIKQSDKATTK